MTGVVAWLFPGQASQYVGMGQRLYEQNKTAKAVYDEAADILHFDIARLSFEGPAETLKQTRYTQPAILVLSVALSQLLEERGLRPGAVAGHSLGEYSAVVAAQAMTFQDSLDIVKLRAELMQQAGVDQPGTMAAIVGLSARQVEALCRRVSEEDLVQAANYNGPDQTVVAGTPAGVQKAMAQALEKGAKRALPLQVSGAFHSQLMASASDPLEEALQKATIQPAICPVIANVSAEPIHSPEAIRSALSAQLVRPVRWQASIERLRAMGMSTFLEVGPGRVLRGLMRKIDRAAQVLGVEDLTTLEKAVTTLKAD